MLTELCQEIHNWFEKTKYLGTFTIENGNIAADFLIPGQYFRIMGSIFSDGIHQYPSSELPSETFTGAVWALAIPPHIVALSEEIDAWRSKYETADSAAMSPYQSESFGGYSYSKSGTSANGGTACVSWKDAFASRLNAWRKL